MKTFIICRLPRYMITTCHDNECSLKTPRQRRARHDDNMGMYKRLLSTSALRRLALRWPLWHAVNCVIAAVTLSWRVDLSPPFRTLQPAFCLPHSAVPLFYPYSTIAMHNSLCASYRGSPFFLDVDRLRVQNPTQNFAHSMSKNPIPTNNNNNNNNLWLKAQCPKDVRLWLSCNRWWEADIVEEVVSCSWSARSADVKCLEGSDYDVGLL